jgi:hypothetical protein
MFLIYRARRESAQSSTSRWLPSTPVASSSASLLMKKVSYSLIQTSRLLSFFFFVLCLLTQWIFRRSLRKNSIDSWIFRKGDEAFTPLHDAPGGLHLLPPRASRYYHGPACLNIHLQQGVGQVLLECGNTQDKAIQSVRHLQSGEGVPRSKYRSGGSKISDRRGAKRPQREVLGSSEVHRRPEEFSLPASEYPPSSVAFQSVVSQLTPTNLTFIDIRSGLSVGS